MTTAANTAAREQGINLENLFSLDAPEPIVSFQRNGRVFRHIFHHLTAADHQAYCDNLSMEFTGDGRSFVYTDAARLVLYARATQRVEGDYRTRDGREPEKLPTWPECIPRHHRLTAIELLLKNRGFVMVDTLRLAPDGRSVTFAVTRDEGESSQKEGYFRVIHRFLAPKVEHRRRFLRAMKMEGSRHPHAALVKLYDELIDRIEGYSIFGRELRAREEIAREMDASHKGFAIVPLLSAAATPAPATRVGTH